MPTNAVDTTTSGTASRTPRTPPAQTPRTTERRSAKMDQKDSPAKSSGRKRIDLGSIDDLRILNEFGEADDQLDPDLPKDDLLRVHRAMVLTRKFDQRMLNMQRQGEMGTFAPGVGQEATQIGQVFPLTKDDWFAPSYRSFGAQLWRGWEMERLLLLWAGYYEGFPPPEGVNDLPFCIVIGSHVLPAVGVAMGMKYRNDNSAMVCNFGDGAISQGPVCEAFNFAAVNQAPVVFICENNGWAISMPAAQQAAHQSLAQRGAGFGIPSIRVDGNDILAMIVACTEATERARAGKGPTLIEAVTYRMGVHTTADDPKVYRSDDEVESWKAKCPILRFERYLTSRSILDEKSIERVGKECEQEVLAARDRFRERAIAKPREVFDHTYAELPPELEAQRQEYLAKLDRKGVE